MENHDIHLLVEELEEYRREKDNIRKVLGSIGGSLTGWRETLFNYVFVGIMFWLFMMDIYRHFNTVDHKLPGFFSLQLGVFLVSIKVIWMIHLQTKIAHFQFWILNSIEFRLNSISKIINEIRLNN
ncbi:MAG: hypothetical protein PHQ23_14245 [Candidatus Wallbacteria bacterium]|nr:hypothetical protein [Candidatus Wallbacteria bacterium]